MLVPIFNRANNQNDYLKVISNDLFRHLNNLKNKTYVISGQMKGKTQLPIPIGADKLTDDHINRARRYYTKKCRLEFFFVNILEVFFFT